MEDKLEYFKSLIDKSIPTLVTARLQPYRDMMHSGNLVNDKNDEIKLAVDVIKTEFGLYHAFGVWNQYFVKCFNDSTKDTITERMNSLPYPPLEQPGMWQYLISISQQGGVKGLAACIVIYNIACARAVRQYKDMNNSHKSDILAL